MSSNKNRETFNSWFLAIPGRAMLMTLLFVLLGGLGCRFALYIGGFLHKPSLNEILLSIPVALLGALIVYRHAKKLQREKFN
jgi:hypothetical protein